MQLDPLVARKHSIDLVPASCYWRDPTPSEARKVDFAAIEAEEGRDLEEFRQVLGIILARSMEDHVAWSNRLTAGRTPDPPALFVKEYSRVFWNLLVQSFGRGATEVQRQASRFYGTEQQESFVELTSFALRVYEKRSQLLGQAFADAIVRQIRPIMSDAFVGTTEIYDAEERERQIRTVYAGLVERSSSETIELVGEHESIEEIHFAGRRMKVRNRAQYEKWQKHRKPYSQWIKQSAEDLRAQSLAPPHLTPAQAKAWLVTERTRYRTAGAREEAKFDPRVKWIQYVAIRDGKTCSKCKRRDGTIRPKDDAFWKRNNPPLHWHCRCDLIVVFREERLRVTPKRKLPGADDLQPGFGAYSPKKVMAAKKIGIVPTRRKRT